MLFNDKGLPKVETRRYSDGKKKQFRADLFRNALDAGKLRKVALPCFDDARLGKWRKIVKVGGLEGLKSCKSLFAEGIPGNMITGGANMTPVCSRLPHAFAMCATPLVTEHKTDAFLRNMGKLRNLMKYPR